MRVSSLVVAAAILPGLWWTGPFSIARAAGEERGIFQQEVVRGTAVPGKADVGRNGALPGEPVQRVAEATPQEPPEPAYTDPIPGGWESPDFSGTWHATSSAGYLYVFTLTQMGDTVEGSCRSGSVTGRMERQVVDGELFWIGTQPGHEWGGKFQVSADGRRLIGTYSNNTDVDQHDGDWTGEWR